MSVQESRIMDLKSDVEKLKDREEEWFQWLDNLKKTA